MSAPKVAALPERLVLRGSAGGEEIYAEDVSATTFVCKTRPAIAAELVRRYNAHEALVAIREAGKDALDTTRGYTLADGMGRLRDALSAAEGGTR